MRPTCSKTSATLDGSPFGLCSAIEGVDFWSTLDDGHRVRCVITRAALQWYGASATSTKSWLAVFVANRHDIHGCVVQAIADRQGVDLVLLDCLDAAVQVYLRARPT